MSRNFPTIRATYCLRQFFNVATYFYVGFHVSKWANGTTKLQDIERGWFNVTGPLVNRNSFELEKTLTAGFCFGFICGNSLVTRADVGGVDATIPSVPRPSASVFHWRRPPFICAGGVEVTRGKMSLIVTSLLSSSESESLYFIISVPVPTCFFMAPQASSSSKSSSIASDEDGLRYKGARTILKQHHRKKAKFIRGMQCCSEVYLTKRNFVKT